MAVRFSTALGLLIATIGFSPLIATCHRTAFWSTGALTSITTRANGEQNAAPDRLHCLIRTRTAVSLVSATQELCHSIPPEESNFYTAMAMMSTAPPARMMLLAPAQGPENYVF